MVPEASSEAAPRPIEIPLGSVGCVGWVATLGLRPALPCACSSVSSAAHASRIGRVTSSRGARRYHSTHSAKRTSSSLVATSTRTGSSETMPLTKRGFRGRLGGEAPAGRPAAAVEVDDGALAHRAVSRRPSARRRRWARPRRASATMVCCPVLTARRMGPGAQRPDVGCGNPCVHGEKRPAVDHQVGGERCEPLKRLDADRPHLLVVRHSRARPGGLTVLLERAHQRLLLLCSYWL